MSGLLVAIVGPSGGGKDTLLNAARAALAGDPSYVFLQRAITRPADPGGEDHRSMSRPEFLRAADAGAFALRWDAHGLLYGIPRDALETALDDRRVAVANLSRHVLREAASRYPLRVVNITAPLAVRARRLAMRGREEPAEVARRLSRDAGIPHGLDVREIENAGTVEAGRDALLAALREAVPAIG